MPVCTQCTCDKDAGEFYAHPQSACGHASVCKECHKTRMKIRARTNPKVQEYDRQRAKTPQRKERSKAIRQKWRAENPVAYKAHSAVSNAIRDGKLKRLSCEFCGREDTHAHHKDYSKPLDVMWLCPKCHHRLHAAFPELEGKMKTGNV